MRPRCSAAASDDHQPACHAHPMEPPTVMDPVPALDEVTPKPGHQEQWGHDLRKKQTNML